MDFDHSKFQTVEPSHNVAVVTKLFSCLLIVSSTVPTFKRQAKYMAHPISGQC